MPQPTKIEVERVHSLPHLILHPFTESSSTVQVLESAKASLSLMKEGSTRDGRQRELELHVLEGRYAELRMLFYVGKDVFRWIDQCVDTCGRSPELSGLGISEASFSHLLIKQTPVDVGEKLKSWGVIEYARIFARSIGIYNQFGEPPPQDMLQPEYLRSYYRYADYAYTCWRDAKKYPVLPEQQFPFTLYASGEYTKMLEEQWKESVD